MASCIPLTGTARSLRKSTYPPWVFHFPEMQELDTEMSDGQVEYTMPFDTNDFSRAVRKRFAGNGMDFLALGSWVGYCLGNV